MRWGTEAWLVALIVGLYLYDSLLLLGSDEAVLIRGWRGRWRAAFGANGWKLAGREPYLPPPYAPHLPLLRLSWPMLGAVAAAPARREVQVPAEATALAWPVLAAAACLLVWLPAMLLAQAGAVAIVVAAVATYLAIAAALAMAWRARDAFGVGGRRFAALAFECVVCPPFAPNLIRKLYSAQRVDESFTAAAARLLPEDEMRRVEAQCLLRIAEQIDVADEGSARQQGLERARARFAARARSGDEV